MLFSSIRLTLLLLAGLLPLTNACVEFTLVANAAAQLYSTATFRDNAVPTVCSSLTFKDASVAHFQCASSTTASVLFQSGIVTINYAYPTTISGTVTMTSPNFYARSTGTVGTDSMTTYATESLWLPCWENGTEMPGTPTPVPDKPEGAEGHEGRQKGKRYATMRA